MFEAWGAFYTGIIKTFTQFFSMIIGKLPFMGSTSKDTATNIIKKEIAFPNSKEIILSIEIKDLIGKLLIKDFLKRITIS